jgi:hypothetical protein
MRETTSSLPRLTAAALSRALNLEQGSRLLTVRLPGAVDAEDLAKCFTLNGNGVPDICELEPGKQNASDDDAAPVFVDASNYYRANKHDIEKDSAALIDYLEPGYLDFCDWGPFIWCLYALALSGRTRAAVVLPADLLDKAEQARTILIREGLIESVVYLPLSEPRPHMTCALLILSSGNRSVAFRSVIETGLRFRYVAKTSYSSDITLTVSPDWSRINTNTPRSTPIETTTFATRELLLHRAALSKSKISLISLTRNYRATLGDTFTRVAPFMPRESTTSNDIDAVEVRRISSQDFQDGNLLPADAVESAKGSDSRIAKVDPSVLDRYELRAGDIVMPRMLGRYGASNLLVVSADDAKQHLVASHNTTVIRPSFQTMTEDERVVFSEIIVGYLTEGHGAQLIQALTEAASIRAIRPSDLFEIEVPPALDPRTREYSESINRFAEVVRTKKQAEATVAQAQRDLEGAKKAVTQVVDQTCE